MTSIYFFFSFVTSFRFSRTLLMSDIFSDFILDSKILHLPKESDVLLSQFLTSTPLTYLCCLMFSAFPYGRMDGGPCSYLTQPLLLHTGAISSDSSKDIDLPTFTPLTYIFPLSTEDLFSLANSTSYIFCLS